MGRFTDGLVRRQRETGLHRVPGWPGWARINANSELIFVGDLLVTEVAAKAGIVLPAPLDAGLVTRFNRRLARIMEQRIPAKRGGSDWWMVVRLRALQALREVL